jgi:nitroreductase
MQSQDIFKIINNRRSIRKFTEKPISKEVLKKILVAGQRAPFAFQGWSVVYTRECSIYKKARKNEIENRCLSHN